MRRWRRKWRSWCFRGMLGPCTNWLAVGRKKQNRCTFTTTLPPPPPLSHPPTHPPPNAQRRQQLQRPAGTVGLHRPRHHLLLLGEQPERQPHPGRGPERPAGKRGARLRCMYMRGLAGVSTGSRWLYRSLAGGGGYAGGRSATSPLRAVMCVSESVSESVWVCVWVCMCRLRS